MLEILFCPNRKRYWVFGLVQRGTRKSHFEIVDQRDGKTLMPIIEVRFITNCVQIKNVYRNKLETVIRL